MSLLTEKINHEAHGILGGENARVGLLQIEPNRDILPKGITKLKKGDRVTLEVPGGGGYGSVEERSQDLIEHDKLHGYTSK